MSDPGLDALREFAKIPVIGPAHASAFVAASLGHSFSILGTMNEMGHKFISQMQEYGIAEKLASVRTTGLSVQQVETEPDLMFPAMIREAEKAVDQDGAHVLIPGCTGMIGIAARLQEALEKRNIYVPVLEGPAIGVKVAEMLTDLNLSQSKVTYPFPPPKDLRGYEDLETRL
jgi:allantoin racemase